ncbi:MAG: hypothetical protein PHR82_07330 [Endomicrobiaceae bacterium]|nr:hypothetical protein [Endomicrobiaceae bacterium]
MSLKNCDISFNNGGVGNFTAEFFAVSNVSNDIVSSMMRNSDVAGSRINNNSMQDDNVFDIAFIPIGQTTFKSAYKNIKNELKKNEYLQLKSLAGLGDVDYPLKIPFWQFIVFILLFRMLFNVLPRSVSVTGIINRRYACALL